VLQRRGALVAAREQLLLCAQKGCPKPIAADCSGWLSEVEQSLSSVVFAVSDDEGVDLVNVHVTANGAAIADKADGRALPLDPGLYVLRFEAPGHSPGEQSITVRQSEKNRIVRMQLRRTPAVPKPQVTMNAESLYASEPADSGGKSIPVASYVFGGVAVVGLGMFTYFGLSELSAVKEKEKLDATNVMREQNGQPPLDCGDLCEQGQRDFILAYVGLGVAVTGATGAVLAYVLSDPEPPARGASTQLRVLPLASQRGALLQVQGTF